MPALLPPGAREPTTPRMDAGAGARRSTPTRSSPSSATRRRHRARCAPRRRFEPDEHERPGTDRRTRPTSPPSCAYDAHPRAGAAPRRGPAARLARVGAGRQGRAPGRGDRAASPRRWVRTTAPCEMPDHRAAARPLFAAMVNAAASHFAEQDDVHNGSVFHPAAVVFPPALAVAQALGCSGRELLDGRGRRLRGRHPRRRVPRPLALQDLPHHRHRRHAGRRGAAGRLLGLDAGADAACLRLGRHAGGGLWEFLRDAADSKQLHTAKAAADGPDGGLPRARRLHRRAADPRRRAGHGRRHVERCRSGAADRPPRRSAGRWPRPRSSSTRRAATRTRPPTRCCR